MSQEPFRRGNKVRRRTDVRDIVNATVPRAAAPRVAHAQALTAAQFVNGITIPGNTPDVNHATGQISSFQVAQTVLCDEIRRFTTPLNLLPRDATGALDFADASKVTGRTSSRGFEGLAITPDGKSAYAMLQSAMTNESRPRSC